MNDADIPILKRTHDLYRTFHNYRKLIPKSDRFTIYERAENNILDILERFYEASYSKGQDKSTGLEKASVKLNTLRFFIRIMKESKSLDNKKYTLLQEIIDEIGRMLGGWIRSTTSTR